MIEKRRRAEERRAREERRIVEAPTETEQRGGDERRMLADRRRRTLLAAKVIYNDRQSVIDCTVRNLSRSGARLFFETVSEVPDRFELDFGQSGPRWCEVAYRAANQFGVHFIDLETDAAEAGVASVSSSAVGARPAPTVDNPMGLEGFEFVEFAAPNPELLEQAFTTLGFAKVARHRSKEVDLWRQGGINFIVNKAPRSLAAYFADEHGPSACGLAFRVGDSHLAHARAIELGAQPIDIPTGPMELKLPAIRGIGGASIYLIDRFEDGASIYDIDFRWLEGAERRPVGHGLKLIDKLTHNVYRGRMAHWAGFYEHLFGFRELRHFDISGEYTGLTSKALTAPDGKIRIPLNEESGAGGGQIEEFLLAFNGEGIQHIALSCEDLPATVDRLRSAGLDFMPAPSDAYYAMLEQRLPGHGEPVAGLKSRGILLDGTTMGGDVRLLLQIFSQTLLGPVFFEFIQRKGDEGFGEGNFKALFESIERDQIDRGAVGDRRD